MITGNQCFFLRQLRDGGGAPSTQDYMLNAYLFGMGEIEQTLEPLDASVLATKLSRRWHPGDLLDPGQVELRAFFDTEDAQNFWKMDNETTDYFTPGMIYEMLTEYQIKDPANNSVAATLQGYGFFVGRVYPELINDQLAQARITWQWNGWAHGQGAAIDQAGPIFSPERATP